MTLIQLNYVLDHTNVVKILVSENGVNINKKNWLGQTALQVAIEMSKFAILFNYEYVYLLKTNQYIWLNISTLL